MIRHRHTAAAVIATFFAAIAPARASIWTTQTIHTAPANFYATSLAHLPDGRFVLGFQGKVFVQSALDSPAKTDVPAGALSLDPSFVAVASATSALVGAGGFGGARSADGVHAATLREPEPARVSFFSAPVESRAKRAQPTLFFSHSAKAAHSQRSSAPVRQHR